MDLDVIVLQRLAHGLDRRAVLVAGGHVQFGEGEVGVAGAAKLEAAGAQQRGEAQDQQIPFHHVFAFPLQAVRRHSRGRAPASISWRLC
ncbi:hypothetical protein D9M71_656430 [compost metagenome]